MTEPTLFPITRTCHGPFRYETSEGGEHPKDVYRCLTCGQTAYVEQCGPCPTIHWPEVWVRRDA